MNLKKMTPTREETREAMRIIRREKERKLLDLLRRQEKTLRVTG